DTAAANRAAGRPPGRLAPDGLAYLRLPARRRAPLAREAGLELGPGLLDVGGRLVPAERAALRWALGSGAASTRGRLAGLAPTRVLELAAPAAIARRPGARPLGAWLRERGSGTAVVTAPDAALLPDGDRLRLAGQGGPG